MDIKKVIYLETQIKPSSEGNPMRLDQALAKQLPEHSRMRLKGWIEAGQVWVDGKIKEPSDKVYGGEQILIKAEVEIQGTWEGEEIPLNIVFEDDHLIVINKPANLVVHPAVGNRAGTLVNALLHHAPVLKEIPRAGIVHRLDKDTTGLMVVAKSLVAHTSLVSQLHRRKVHRIYEAIVQGVMLSGGTIDAPMARNPQDRKRMAVVVGGKPAISHYRILEKFKHHTHIRVQLETGRTHQIRVHMAHIHYPLVGDKIYGWRFKSPPKVTSEPAMSALEVLKHFKRQALHARELGLIHPVSKEEMHWEVGLPEDMKALIRALRVI